MNPINPYMYTYISILTHIRFPQEGRDLKFAENVLMQGLASNRDSASLVFHMGLCCQLADRLSQVYTYVYIYIYLYVYICIYILILLLYLICI
jgi:hypothetical protein